MTRRAAKDVLHFVLFAHAVTWVAWLGYAFAVAPSPPERDWFVLREIGRSFLAGDWASVYADRQTAEGTMFFATRRSYFICWRRWRRFRRWSPTG